MTNPIAQLDFDLGGGEAGESIEFVILDSGDLEIYSDKIFDQTLVTLNREQRKRLLEFLRSADEPSGSNSP